MSPETASHSDRKEANPEWFREATPREHRIAAFLFIGFGVFFVLLFVVLAGWWFRWVILGLSIVSVLFGMNHGRQLWPKRVG